MKRFLAPASGLLLVAGALAPAPSFADSAPADPTDPRTPPTVTADALPTVQINGVVWDQEIVGSTVYVVGEFSSARPAGASAGQQETPRANILAYELETGKLIQAFAPRANAVVRTVAASPDGGRLYIGGSFTQINGETRYRIAALDPTTGALDADFRPAPDSRVNAIATDGSTVYFGGWFSAVGNQPRGRLAAVDARTGQLRAWTPVADAPVDALVLSPDGRKIVAGGAFESLNGSADPGMGMGAISTADGSLLPWKVGSTVRNGVGEGGISSLTTDGTHVYGTGWTWLRNSNFEGTFKATWADGSIEWLEDCHGDSYDAVPHSEAVYVANHAHNCESLGEFTDTRPRTFYRGVAFSKEVTGILGSTRDSYFDFSGHPAPSMLNWYPNLDGGTYTGQYQAAWTVETAGDYVVMGGEFPRVNGTAQQGLVRFTTRAKAPNAVGPQFAGDAMGLTAASHRGGTVSLTWTAASDQDNQNLTYRIVRDGNTAGPVGELSGRHRFYNRDRMSFTDFTAEPGRSHTYRVIVSDPLGNTAASNQVQVTTASGAAPSGYVREVLEDRPTHYWPMGDPAAGLVDVAGGARLVPSGRVAGPVDGTVAGSEDATGFAAGDALQPSGFASTDRAEPGPHTFSAETWVRTTTGTGGKILGFSDSTDRTGSRSADRHLWMSSDGRLHAGVYPDRVERASSTRSYNDGQWHQVVMTLGADGLFLYVDGQRVAHNAAPTSAEYYDGYWNLGDGSLRNWPGAPTTTAFTGDIDDTSIYGQALAPEQVQAHYAAATAAHPEEPTPEEPAPEEPAPEEPEPEEPAGPGVLVDDSFDRTGEGFGSPREGVVWSVWSANAALSTGGGTGTVAWSAPAASVAARLSGVDGLNTDTRTAVRFDPAPSGGGGYFSVRSRLAERDFYAATLRGRTGSTSELSLRRTIDGQEEVLANVPLAGLSVGSDRLLNVRFETVSAPAGGTSLRAKVWAEGAAEPSAWQVEVQDATAELQDTGEFGLGYYISGSATNAPGALHIDRFTARSTDPAAG